MTVKIALAGDHRGVEMKARLFAFLKSKGFEPVDCGPFTLESCDYPDFMFDAAEKVARGDCRFGIGICHSGIGSAIAANKVRGIRAALCKSVEEAKLSRAHNDANMLILGSGFLDTSIVETLVETWLSTPFEG
ncbi:MAG: RpiB/LacA/LacB family sugar-phosphate isomerase, partial [Candidatus Omnitrophica bacterium]|nr:RpiB/LacA/LacB family sugar-phosphate isomerase [Candidatus Omnitrophota bacterium]